MPQVLTVASPGDLGEIMNGHDGGWYTETKSLTVYSPGFTIVALLRRQPRHRTELL